LGDDPRFQAGPVKVGFPEIRRKPAWAVEKEEKDLLTPRATKGKRFSLDALLNMRSAQGKTAEMAGLIRGGNLFQEGAKIPRRRQRREFRRNI